MAKALLVDQEENAISILERQFHLFFPEFEICAVASSVDEALHAIEEKEPDILFMGISPPLRDGNDLLSRLSRYGFATLIATKAPRLGELMKLPLKNGARVSENELPTPSTLPRLIGIPTLKGMDFFPVEDIIRCEGLSRCTRIFAKDRSNMVSGYNLGEFTRLLTPYFFFSPHRSHLVNLRHVKSYNREGTIVMRDDSCVPVSKQKKAAFLEMMVHV